MHIALFIPVRPKEVRIDVVLVPGQYLLTYSAGWRPRRPLRPRSFPEVFCWLLFWFLLFWSAATFCIRHLSVRQTPARIFWKFFITFWGTRQHKMQAGAPTGREGSQIEPRFALGGFVSKLQAIKVFFKSEVSKWQFVDWNMSDLAKSKLWAVNAKRHIKQNTNWVNICWGRLQWVEENRRFLWQASVRLHKQQIWFSTYCGEWQRQVTIYQGKFT